MIAAIHQPNFLPWIGYFHKIKNADIFVFLDDVQFTKNGFTNRNKIKTAQGEHWLTLPIIQAGKFKQNINECLILNKDVTVSKIIKTIQLSYSKARHFEWLFDDLRTCLLSSSESLCEMNLSLIKLVLGKLEINKNLVLSSTLIDVQGASTERLVNICKSVNCSEYIFGGGGQNYQDEQIFTEGKIDAHHSNFIHPQYHQLGKDFIPNLSIIDLLFNEGQASINFIS